MSTDSPPWIVCGPVTVPLRVRVKVMACGRTADAPAVKLLSPA